MPDIEQELLENESPEPDADLEDLIDESDAPIEAPAEQTAAQAVAPAFSAPSPPSGINWTVAGPRLWSALHNLMRGNKTKHDDKYVIEVSHDAVGEAHDALKQ